MNTNPGATQIGAQGATLRANVVCGSHEICVGYFRWRVHGTGAWHNGTTLGPILGPLVRPIGYAAQLSPANTYDYQFCGRRLPWSRYVCVGPTAAWSASGIGDPRAWSTFTTLATDRTVTAQQFADSIGVNDHITYGDEPLYVDQPRAVWNMKALGVTHVRVPIFDSSNSGWQAYFLSKFRVVQQAGFKIDAQVSETCTNRYPAWDLRNPGDCVAALQRSVGLRGVEAFEVPNEPDNNGDPNWAAKLTSYDRAIHAAVKGAGNYLVYGPALRYDSSFATLGNQAGTFDVENFHDYTGATSLGPGTVRDQFIRQVPLAGLKPAVATESGYHNAVGCQDGCQPGIDRAGAAVYTLRTYLEHLADGVDRTYTYELYDEPNLTCPIQPCQEAQFGLIDGSGRWKPAAHALANLTTMIGKGAPDRVTPLRWGVAAGDSTSDLRDLDVERPDGSHDLVLWRTCTEANVPTCAASVWNVDAQTDRAVAPVTIHVIGSFRAWAVGDPITGSGFWPGSGQIVVRLGADPIVLHITP